MPLRGFQTNEYNFNYLTDIKISTPIGCRRKYINTQILLLKELTLEVFYLIQV